MLKLLLLLIFAISSYCDDVPKLPLYVGIGYDVVLGNPETNRLDCGFKNNIFRITYDDGATTDDGKFLIPDKMTARVRQSCSLSSSTKEYTGTNSYQKNLNVLVEISTSATAWLVDVSFSASAEYKSMQESTTEEESMVFDSKAQCEAYSLEFDMYDAPELSNGFRNAILAAAKNPKDKTLWQNIIKTYGTHFINRAYYGGRMHLQNRVQRKKVQELSSMGIDVKFAAELKYMSFTGTGKTEVEANIKELNAFESKTAEVKQIYIGGKPPKTGDWLDWYEEVLTAPMPTSYSVFSLSVLISKANFPELDSKKISILRKEFDASLKDYCGKMNCVRPGIDPPFPSNITTEAHFTDLLSVDGYDNLINFQDKVPTNPFLNVRKVFVYANTFFKDEEWIEGMRFILSDSVNTVFSPYHGNDRGLETYKLYEWLVPEGEYITQVEVKFSRYGDGVTRMQFFTNRGTSSPNFGNSKMGTRYLYELEGQLVGIRGFNNGTVGFATFGLISTTFK